MNLHAHTTLETSKQALTVNAAYSGLDMLLLLKESQVSLHGVQALQCDVCWVKYRLIRL